MKKKLLAGAVLAALLSTTALADTSSINPVTSMGVLENEWVKAGVNVTAGSFGSGGSTSPGLLFDPAGTGTFDTGYDYLTPGSPFDGFAVNVDGTNYSNNNARTNAIEGSGSLSDGENTLTWYGAFAGAGGIINTYTLAPNTPYIDITSTIELGEDATDVWFGRFIDPDSQGMPGDSSSTDNVLGYGVIPDSNVAFSEATVSRYALGLYSTDSNVDAGITVWSQEADAYVNADASCGTGVLFCNEDHTIGLSWHWTGVSAGDILTANYAYIFGPSAFDAAEDAITGGAGGGADTSSWGTLEDVGSATDAASGTTTAPVITYSDPVVDTDRPVLTASITHHEASETATVQTIARERTTTVTTPMEIIEYTDGVETDRAVTDSVIVTTVTDPGSFTGRIDQSATVQDVVGSTLRTLDFNNIQGVRMNSTYNNGMEGNTNGVVVGGTKELENGVSISGGFTRLGTSMSGNSDSVSAETTAFAGGIEKNNVKLELRRATTDYEVTRTIGDFANASETQGTDTSVRVTYSPDTGKVTPVIGYTRGKRTMDGYTETGSIQSARTVGATDDMYGYGTVGLRGDLGLVDFTAMHHTDGVNDISLGLEKDTGTVTWRLEGTRSMTNLGNTNAISAGLVIKF